MTKRVGSPSLKLLNHFCWGFGLTTVFYTVFVYFDVKEKSQQTDMHFEEWAEKQKKLDEMRKEQGLEISAEKRHMIDQRFQPKFDDLDSKYSVGKGEWVTENKEVRRPDM